MTGPPSFGGPRGALGARKGAPGGPWELERGPSESSKGALVVGFLEDNNHIPRGVSGGKHEILGTGVVFDAE